MVGPIKNNFFAASIRKTYKLETLGLIQFSTTSTTINDFQYNPIIVEGRGREGVGRRGGEEKGRKE